MNKKEQQRAHVLTRVEAGILTAQTYRMPSSSRNLPKADSYQKGKEERPESTKHHAVLRIVYIYTV